MKNSQCALWMFFVFSSVMATTLPAYSQDTASGSMEQRYADHLAKVDRRLDRFRDELQITPLQQSAWVRYTAAIRDNMKDMHIRMAQEVQHLHLTAPEHFDHMLSLKQWQMEDFKNVVNAFNGIYVALSPAQKRIADEHFERMRKLMVEHSEDK